MDAGTGRGLEMTPVPLSPRLPISPPARRHEVGHDLEAPQVPSAPLPLTTRPPSPDLINVASNAGASASDSAASGGQAGPFVSAPDGTGSGPVALQATASASGTVQRIVSQSRVLVPSGVKIPEADTPRRSYFSGESRSHSHGAASAGIGNHISKRLSRVDAQSPSSPSRHSSRRANQHVSTALAAARRASTAAGVPPEAANSSVMVTTEARGERESDLPAAGTGDPPESLRNCLTRMRNMPRICGARDP